MCDIWSPRMPYIKNHTASVIPINLNKNREQWKVSFLYDFFSDQTIIVWGMAVGLIRFDLRIRLSLKFKELKLLTRVNISTRMTPKHLAKVCKVVMLKSYLFFPCPSGTLSSIFLWPFVLKFYNFEKGWPLGLKGPRDPGVQRSKGPVFLLLWTFWFVLWVICFCCEYLGWCCELFVIAVNILVCAVSYLLLWISWFVLCELFGIAVNILVCAVSYLLLLWTFWFVLWVICCCCDSCGPPYKSFGPEIPKKLKFWKIELEGD